MDITDQILRRLEPNQYGRTEFEGLSVWCCLSTFGGRVMAEICEVCSDEFEMMQRRDEVKDDMVQ